MKLVYARQINEHEIGGLVDVSSNPPKVFCYTENEENAIVILKLFQDNKAHENRIRILTTLNTNYRDKLGISNEPMDLDLLTNI